VYIAGDRGLAYQVELLLSVCDYAVRDDSAVCGTYFIYFMDSMMTYYNMNSFAISSQNRIRAFIRTHSKYEYGSVSHAVAGAIKAMMREFDVVLAQFESLLASNRLTLQKMIFLLQPTKSTLRALDHMASRLGDRVGGSMLDRLHSAMLEQGDERSRKLYEHILTAATVPFVRMISRWLYQGELRDPYSEFFICEHTTVLREALQEDFNAHYWEGRYTLNTLHVPRILQEHANKALIAGKYLNVIRDCCPGLAFRPVESTGDSSGHRETAVVFPTGDDTSASLIKRDLSYDMDGSTTLIDAIEEAYDFSSETLLRLCENKYNLYSHLKSLRRFFLLEHGDFFVQFMDTAEEELRREAKDVALPRIQGLLHLAVHTSTLSTDPNKDELSCTLAAHNLIQHLHLIQMAGEGGAGPSGMDNYSVLGAGQGLKGVEALTLEYNVGWPLSIILSKRAITKYQLLSRLLFFCKHVELRVLDSWKDHQGTKEFGLRGEMGPSYCLRHRMLHFLQNFVYYMTIEVFTPRSHEMESAMSEARNMDEVLHLHEVFLDTCLKECLLASQDLLRILTKITTTCLLFADQMKRFADTSDILDPELREQADDGGAGEKSAALRSARIRVQAEFISREVTHEAYVRMLAKFSETFDSQLGEFLEKLWTDSYR
jgi:gamma-tubulin complex component 2